MVLTDEIPAAHLDPGDLLTAPTNNNTTTLGQAAAQAAAPTAATRGPKSGARDENGNLEKWFDEYDWFCKFVHVAPQATRSLIHVLLLYFSGWGLWSGPCMV